jgi:hypothetical protein
MPTSKPYTVAYRPALQHPATAVAHPPAVETATMLAESASAAALRCRQMGHTRQPGDRNVLWVTGAPAEALAALQRGADPGESDVQGALQQAIGEAEAYKWAYQRLQARMHSIGRHGWAHDCDEEIIHRITAAVEGKTPNGG